MRDHAARGRGGRVVVNDLAPGELNVPILSAKNGRVAGDPIRSCAPTRSSCVSRGQGLTPCDGTAMVKERLRFGARMMLWALVVIFALSWGQAPAQTWPQPPVKIIVPLGPGAGVDITARLLGDRLGARWGQSVVIDNRPGGDGAVAMAAFTAAQDDHTLLMSPTSSFTHHPWLYDKLPYDPLDLVPIARVSNTIGCDRGAVFLADPFIGRPRDHGTRGARQAELGHHHRLFRFHVRSVFAEGQSADGKGPVPQHGSSCQRSRRGTHSCHDGGVRDYPASRRFRKVEDSGVHRA